MPLHGFFNRRAIPDYVKESQWLMSDGWPLRRIDWPVPEQPRGALLFMPGRGDFYEKYLETLEYWANRGWIVTALDWRGQAGSGRLGADPVTGHINDFGQWTADLTAFWPTWKAANPGPHVLAGHSMGGHLVLRTVADGGADPDALILSAPMLGLITHGLPIALFALVTRLMCAIGDPRRPAWKWSEKPGEVPADRSDLLTHDADRYADELYWRSARPELLMGPGSWGWVRAAIASIRRLDRREVLTRITIPVMMVAARVDALVSVAAIDRAARWLPNVTYLRLGDEARHEVLREVDPVRDRVLGAIDEFLDRVVPAAD